MRNRLVPLTSHLELSLAEVGRRNKGEKDRKYKEHEAFFSAVASSLHEKLYYTGRKPAHFHCRG